MTLEAEKFLQKADKLLSEAGETLRLDLADAAGRAAYMAAFHAAQAYIWERTSRILKTHAGVHSEFSRLAQDDRRLDAQLRGFVARAYDLKTIADYEIGEDAAVDPLTAASACETARIFVSEIRRILSIPKP